MVEMLGTLAIISVLSMASLWALSGVMNRFRANDLLEEASARAMRVSEQIKKGRKTLSLGKFSHNETMGGTFSKQVFTSGLYQQFAIQVSDVNKAVCERLLNSIEDTTPLRRLSLVNSPTVAITECNDDNTFLMVYNSTIKGEEQDKKYCESDKDCDTVCGECNENHICRNECEIPRPDLNSDFGQECGENECIIYDEESQSCKYSCERVEYLESTGTQWIDTGIIGDKYSSVENSVYLIGRRSNSCAVGSWGENTATERVWLSYFFDNHFRVGWGSENRSNGVEVFLNTWYEWKTKIENNRHIQYINGEKVFTSRSSTADFTTDQNIYLFGMNSRGIIDYQFNGRMGYVKLYDNASLVRDFIPVISPDGEACMFDKVSKKLFRNSGTGTFKTNLDE